MFGYIRPYDPELRVAELEVYRSVYCGLCRTLSKSFGPFSRFLLSYDFTFTAMLHIALTGKEADFEVGRCPFKPFAKQNQLSDSSELRFSAAAATLMIYYKLRDNIADDAFPKSLLYRAAIPLIKPAYKRAAKNYPDMDRVIGDAMKKQWDVEQSENVTLDQAAEPSATALSALFVMMAENEPDKRVMARLGYMVGRFVYCCDAIADLDEDQKHGHFNPLLGNAQTPESARASLYLTQAEALAAYDLLGISEMKGILDNIFTLGMRNTTDTVLRGVKSYEQSL